MAGSMKLRSWSTHILGALNSRVKSNDVCQSGTVSREFVLSHVMPDWQTYNYPLG